jgi:ankyrin repeat protein
MVWHLLGDYKFRKDQAIFNPMLVSYRGHCAITKVLLRQGSSMECKDTEYGRTPLSWAAERGHGKVIKPLTQTGKADVSCKGTEYGRTPLSWAAAERGSEKIVRLLHEAGNRIL